MPDEGGTMTIHSATQSIDAVQRAVACTLGVPHHQVRRRSTVRSAAFFCVPAYCFQVMRPCCLLGTRFSPFRAPSSFTRTNVLTHLLEFSKHIFVNFGVGIPDSPITNRKA